MGARSMLGLVLALLPLPLAGSAVPVTATRNIPASTGPWAVTASINNAYPYGSSQTPPVVFNSSDGFGFRAGDALTIQYVGGLWCSSTYVSVGTCVDAEGYIQYPVSDMTQNGIYAPSKYIDPSAYPVYLLQLVGTFADARGQIVGRPFKVGNGPINVSIPEGAAQLQLGANNLGYADARDYYTRLTVSVSGPPPPVMNPAGSIAQLAVGGIWKTTFVLMNAGTVPAQARLNFYGDSGAPLELPLTFSDAPSDGQVALSTVSRTLAAGSSVKLESASPASPDTQQGWTQLATDGDVTAFAIFSQTVGDRIQEVAVPLESRPGTEYALWFDHTSGLGSGIALANLAISNRVISVTIRDEGGSVIGTDTISLPARGHTALLPAERWTQTAQRRGIIEFHSEQGQLAILGLRAFGLALTAMPIAAK